MTPQEKSAATRKTNAALRKEAEAERAAERRSDRLIVIDALRAVLSDSRATPTERLFALEILDYVQNYYFIPSRIKGTENADLSQFKRELETIKSTNT